MQVLIKHIHVMFPVVHISALGVNRLRFVNLKIAAQIFRTAQLVITFFTYFSMGEVVLQSVDIG